MNDRERIDDLEKRLINLESSLQKETHKMNAIFSSMTEAIIGIDDDLNVVLMNQAASILVRVADTDAKGQKISELFPLYKDKDPIDDAHSPIVQAVKEKTIVRTYIYDNIYFKGSDGFYIPVVLSAVYLLGENSIEGMSTLIIIRNVIQEKSVDKAKTELISMASHQLRTPLTSIGWFAEMLLKGEAGPVTNEQKDYLQEIVESNERMTELVDSLLNVSRVDLGTFKVDPKPTALVDVVESLCKELTPMISVKKMNVNKIFSKELPLINVDQTLIRIVLQNLLTNAIKYTPEEGTIDIVLKKQDTNMLISIADSGYGIPKEDQSKIFTKLYRAQNVRDKVTDGNGLGLYIVKAIVEQNGGSIWFSSEENQGTTFNILIPLTGMKAKEGAKALPTDLALS